MVGSVEASGEVGSLWRPEVTAACGAWEVEVCAVENPVIDGKSEPHGTAHFDLVTSAFDLQQ